MQDELKDLVRVADGDLVRIELYQQALKAAGVESRVVGDELEAGLGTALPRSIELWVRQRDVAKAKASIDLLEADRDRPPRSQSAHERPKSDPKPHREVTHGAHPHYDPDPRQ